jgi:hypothetical protein
MFKRIAFSNIGIIENDNVKELLTVSNNKEVISFKYDPDNFVYFRCRAITADVPNKNGDLFPEEEIIKSYKTFIGVGVYKDHDADSVNKAVGKILWADYIPEGKYVELIGCIDKKLDPDLARRVQTGIIDSCSMGCVVKEAECSICHNIARNPSQLCRHMHPTYGIKGSLDQNGNIIYEINRGIQFTELSLVTSPADSTAKLFEVIASNKRKAENKNKKIYPLDISWFRNIENYKNDDLNGMYETIDYFANITFKNDREKIIKNTANILKDLFVKIGIFKQPINEVEFKKMIYNLFYLSDRRAYELMFAYVNNKGKTNINKELNDVINVGSEVYKGFKKAVEYLNSQKDNINLKYAVLYALLNNIYFPTFPSSFKKETGITSILDIFGEISRLIRKFNLDAFSFPIHILGEPFDPNNDIDVDKIATEDEQIFLRIIPLEYRKYALSYIRTMSYYTASGLIKKMGVDKFKEMYLNTFGKDLKKDKLEYLLNNQNKIIGIHGKLNADVQNVGKEINKIFKKQGEVFNYISDGLLLLRTSLLSKYGSGPKNEFLQRFVYGNLTEDDLKNKNILFLKNNQEYIKNPEIMKLVEYLTDYTKNIYKKIHLVKDEQVLLNLIDILKNPSAFLNYTKFANIIKQDEYIRKIFETGKGILMKGESTESVSFKDIKDNYSKLKIYKTNLAKERYEALKKELEKFTPFIDLYEEFLSNVIENIKEIIKNGLNANIKPFDKYNEIMQLSGFYNEKNKVKHIYEKINLIIDKLNKIKENIKIENSNDLLERVKNEIKSLQESVERELYGINEKYNKDFGEEVNKIYLKILNSIKALVFQYKLNLSPNYKMIEDKFVDIENKIKKIVEEYKKEKETIKTIQEKLDLNVKFFNSYYKQIIKEFISFLDELLKYVTTDLLKEIHKKKIEIDIKNLYEIIKSLLSEIKSIISNPTSKKAKIEFKFIKGFGFRTSLIEAKQGDKYVVKRLADIMPKEVMVELLNGNENVITPDEIIDQLSKIVNNLEEFENFFNVNNNEKNVVGGWGTPNDA